MTFPHQPQPHTDGWQDAWEPIETAPRDQTNILACNFAVAGGFMVVVSFELTGSDQWVWHTEDGISYHENAFTHWMHLPNPPSTTQSQIDGETDNVS